MGIFLNSIVPFEEYKDIAGTRFFVDKTPMIDEIISSVALDGQKYFCVTRPRRFGKSVAANMLGAFWEKSTLISAECPETVILMNNISAGFRMALIAI